MKEFYLATFCCGKFFNLAKRNDERILNLVELYFLNISHHCPSFNKLYTRASWGGGGMEGGREAVAPSAIKF